MTTVIDIDSQLTRDEHITIKKSQLDQLLKAAKQAYEDLVQYEYTDLPSGFAVMDTVKKLRAALNYFKGINP
jgi:hypothetical protein